MVNPIPGYHFSSNAERPKTAIRSFELRCHEVVLAHSSAKQLASQLMLPLAQQNYKLANIMDFGNHTHLHEIKMLNAKIPKTTVKIKDQLTFIYLCVHVCACVLLVCTCLCVIVSIPLFFLPFSVTCLFSSPAPYCSSVNFHLGVRLELKC